MTNLEKMLISHEGIKFKPYRDSLGIWTCGVGHNMQEDGDVTQTDINQTWTMERVMTTLKKDLANVKKELSKFAWFIELSEARQDVIIDMAFNLGVPRLLYFEKMIAALRRKDYAEAANQMLDSTWASQVKERAQKLANMMRRGEYLYDV